MLKILCVASLLLGACGARAHSVTTVYPARATEARYLDSCHCNATIVYTPTAVTVFSK